MIESAPYLEDFSALSLAAQNLSHPCLFVSPPGGGGKFNRYSIFTAEPIAAIYSQGPRDYLHLRVEHPFRSAFSFPRFHEAAGVALNLLRPWADDVPHPWPREAMPFVGGLAGGISYEYGAHFEHMKIRPRAPGDPPHVWMGLYVCAYVADHERREGFWVMRPARSAPDPCPAIMEKLRDAVEQARGASGSTEKINAPAVATGDWRDAWEPSLNRADYAAAMEKILEYLKRGDSYQINLTVRYRREFGGDASDLFRRLLHANPASYMAMMRMQGVDLISSSPELFLDARRDGWIETHPIKGTRRAGAEANITPFGEKDRAEHLMIVDLERNDLGRVCKFGTVEVSPLMGIESVRGLEHMVSRVRGRMRVGLGPVDAIAALFPGGSVTGAPKIRAMEIIHELEPVARGYYTGALGWISPEGDARMNLAIRTLALTEGRLDLNVGGGIVADSEADREYEECRLKGSAMAQAVASSLRA